MQTTKKTEEENPESPPMYHHAYQSTLKALYLINSRAAFKHVMAQPHVWSLSPNHENDLEGFTVPSVTSSWVYDLLKINGFSQWDRREVASTFWRWGYSEELHSLCSGIDLNVHACYLTHSAIAFQEKQTYARMLDLCKLMRMFE